MVWGHTGALIKMRQGKQTHVADASTYRHELKDNEIVPLLLCITCTTTRATMRVICVVVVVEVAVAVAVAAVGAS